MSIRVTVFHNLQNMSMAGYCHLCTYRNRYAGSASEKTPGQVLIFNCLAIPRTNS